MRTQVRILFVIAFLAPTFAQGAELFVARKSQYNRQQSHIYASGEKWICNSEIHDRFPVRDAASLMSAAQSLASGPDSDACKDEIVIRVDDAYGESKVRRACTRDEGVMDFLNQLSRACGRS